MWATQKPEVKGKEREGEGERESSNLANDNCLFPLEFGSWLGPFGWLASLVVAIEF